MAQPIGFEEVEPAGGILLKDKDDLPASHSDEKLVVDVEGGRPRLDTATRKAGEETVFFDSDPTKRIDFILAFQLSNAKRDKKHGSEDQDKRATKRTIFRQKCEEEYGLEFEEQDCSDSPDEKTYYWKVHGKWQALLEGAERIGLRMPISSNVLDNQRDIRTIFFERVLKVRDPFEPLIPEEFQTHHYLTAPFHVDQKHLFLDCKEDNADKFFTPAQRSMIVWDILQRVPYGEKEEQYGVERLVDNKSFTAVFPLHDGPYQTKKGELIRSDRQLLRAEWANPFKFYKRQPLNNIRRYFGEKVGLYFAWTGHYTTWLLFASLIGVIIFFYGMSTVTTNRNPIAADTCETNRSGYTFNETTGEVIGPTTDPTFYMCPICDVRCDFWYLQDECNAARASLLFDNGGTVFFAAFMSIWAVLFLEMWKRKQFVLQHRWDVLGYEDAEERPRVEFEREIRGRINKAKTESAKKKYTQWNPVYEKYDLVQPGNHLYGKLAAAFSGLVFMVLVVVAIVFSILLYRIAISAVLYVPLVNTAGRAAGAGASIFASITGACVQLVGILIMNFVYKKLAEKLTDWELHRTTTEYEDSLITKLYIFQFVNFYASIFYIAFFRGNLVGFPGAFNRIGSVRLDECPTYGCFLELTIQLVIILLGKQILNNCVELGVPIGKQLWKRFRHKKGDDTAVYTRWERDYDLPDDDKFGLLPEYLELVIQYGFITIFVAAFPLAPLAALLNNWVEIRLDAYKYVVFVRRQVSERAQDIGAWYGILEVISKLAVVTNAILIAITAEFIPLLTYRININTDILCDNPNTTWPSCDISSEYSGYAGYLNSTSVQYFSVSEMFNDIRPAHPNELVPNVASVSSLNAYQGEEELSFLYLPFINLTCLQQMSVLASGTPFNASYGDFTRDFFNMNPNVTETVPNCIRKDIFCGFRGFGKDSDGNFPQQYWREIAARLSFIIIFEHFIFLGVAVIAWLIPDVPEAVQQEIKKEKLLALEATLKSREGEGVATGGNEVSAL